MASKQPAFGCNAQTQEFDVDLLAAGVHKAGDPKIAEAVVSVDGNATLRFEISAPECADWQLDARIAGGSLDILHGFPSGVIASEEHIAEWVDRVVNVVGERLEGSRWWRTQSFLSPAGRAASRRGSSITFRSTPASWSRAGRAGRPA